MTIDVCSIDVLLHKESMHTLVTRALALTHTRRLCDDGKSVPDFFLPPPHRRLDLNYNQLWILSKSRARVRECV